MLTYLTELSAINTAEICRFYNEIFGRDVDSFSHTDIPVDFHIHHNLSHQASDFTKTYEKLIDIALYYQLGRLETFKGVEIVEGVSLPDISASIVPILCGLRRATHDTQKSQLKKVCKKSITLPIESKPANSAIFAKWLFSILQFSRTEYCHIFNEISGVQLSCNNLSNVADLC
ncbi:uncharacterized protein LOC134705357 [Mytilus trossulus]|uniref:uncharacterized protein LOC134705357 n=1 Tax=Mytilus trossulus TaxID=6551 RepID=UPI0030065DC4